MKHISVIIGAAIILSLPAVKAVHADLYKYTDKDGKEHFVDDIQRVPPEYRAQFLLNEDEEAKKTNKRGLMENARLHQQTTEALTQAADEALDPVRKDSLPVRIVKLVVAIVSLACLAVVLIKGGEYLGYKKIGSLAALAITLVVSGYLFASNLKNVADSYKVLKAKTEALTRKLGKRTAEGEGIMKDMETQQNTGRSDVNP